MILTKIAILGIVRIVPTSDVRRNNTIQSPESSRRPDTPLDRIGPSVYGVETNPTSDVGEGVLLLRSSLLVSLCQEGVSVRVSRLPVVSFRSFLMYLFFLPGPSSVPIGDLCLLPKGFPYTGDLRYTTSRRRVSVFGPGSGVQTVVVLRQTSNFELFGIPPP